MEPIPKGTWDLLAYLALAGIQPSLSASKALGYDCISIAGINPCDRCIRLLVPVGSSYGSRYDGGYYIWIEITIECTNGK